MAQNRELSKNNNDNSLLWEVTGNGLNKPSFLFGTFHLLCKEDIHFGETLKNALKGSDYIYMEMDMDDPSVLMNAMKFMTMKNGKSLKDLYSTREYEKLQKFFSDSLKMPLQLFEKTKPYFLVALLYPKMMECKSPSGVEQELIKLAKEEKKEIEGLETLAFQSSVFDSIPYEWQAKELLKNIDSVQKYKEEFQKMVQIYKNQQLDSLEEHLNMSEFGGERFNELLLTNRNKNWAKRLDSAMKENSVFVAVGAGHLPGKEGVIELLRKKGYSVTPLKND